MQAVSSAQLFCPKPTHIFPPFVQKECEIRIADKTNTIIEEKRKTYELFFITTEN
jgi:hypothetical protein